MSLFFLFIPYFISIVKKMSKVKVLEKRYKGELSTERVVEPSAHYEKGRQVSYKERGGTLDISSFQKIVC